MVPSLAIFCYHSVIGDNTVSTIVTVVHLPMHFRYLILEVSSILSCLHGHTMTLLFVLLILSYHLLPLVTIAYQSMLYIDQFINSAWKNQPSPVSLMLFTGLS